MSIKCKYQNNRERVNELEMLSDFIHSGIYLFSDSSFSNPSENNLGGCSACKSCGGCKDCGGGCYGCKSNKNGLINLEEKLN